MQTSQRIAALAAGLIGLLLVPAVPLNADDLEGSFDRRASARRHRKVSARLFAQESVSRAAHEVPEGETAGADAYVQQLESNHESLDVEPDVERRKTLFRWPGQDDKDDDEDAATDGADDEVEPLVTDRPDFTEASSTVGLGVLQIEGGYTFTYDKAGGVKTLSHSMGEPLFRYGVLDDWLELRLAVFPVSERVTREYSTSGVEDLYLGAKLALTEQADWLPEMAIIPQMTVPTGSSRFSSGETLPGANWVYTWVVTDWLLAAGGTQFNRAIDETGDSYLEYIQTFTLGYTLTDDLGAYTEWFAFIPSCAESADAEHYFNGGFTYRFTPDLQWDIRAGLGLNDSAADFFTGTGLSVRFR